MKKIIILMFSFYCSSLCYADGLGIGSTRVIFPAEKTAVSVNITNSSTETNYLIHPTISGNAETPSATPFVVTPSLFRLNASSENIIKIVNTGSQNLPTDRESLFWLTVTGIPSSKKENRNFSDGVNGGISVAIGNTIKVIYRPSGLVGTLEDSASHLIFSHDHETLLVKNNSPFYINFASIKTGDKFLDIKDSNGIAMVTPFSTQRYHYTGISRNVCWDIINDVGGVKLYCGQIQ